MNEDTTLSTTSTSPISSKVKEVRDTVEEVLSLEAVNTYRALMRNVGQDPTNARHAADKVMEILGLLGRGEKGGSHVERGFSLSASPEFAVEAIKALVVLSGGGNTNGGKNENRESRDVGGKWEGSDTEESLDNSRRLQAVPSQFPSIPTASHWVSVSEGEDDPA